jgi:DNA-binding NarL/FixJ family response regulator
MSGRLDNDCAVPKKTPINLVVMNTSHRIVVVEDDPVLIDGIREELGANHDIVHAPSYTPALNLLYDRLKPTAVIAHLGMQDSYGGAQFMLEVKRIVPAAARLLYSAWPSSRDFALDFADEFLVRPWPTGQLRASLARLLDGGLALKRLG